MRAVNNVPEVKKDSTDFFFYILVGLLGISFLGMIGYLIYSFFA